ncbi:hypothetical protein CRYUN_Cryun02cG0184900 [Craigia yunnanensis]
MASFIESGWLYLITHFSDFQLASMGSFLIHESVFFLSGLPFIYLERAGLLSKYKIQEKCITRLILYHLSVNLPLMIVSYPVFRFMGMKSSLPLPSWYFQESGSITDNILLHPGGFRVLLGTSLFYIQNGCTSMCTVSSMSKYATPFGMTSEYAHPAEILFLGFATIVGPAITGPHLITLWLWMVLRVLETVEAHCGYHFPLSLSNFLPLYGGIFGTDKGYRKLKALKHIGVEDDSRQT